MFARKKPAPVPQPVPAKTEHGSGYEALIFLSENGLSHTPNNYALAWQLKSDHRSLVAIAVDTILMEGRPLTQCDVDRIMTAEARRKKNPDGITDPDHDALRHQTLRLADLAAGAATQSSDFGRDLSGELFHLSGGSGSVEQIVKAMIHRTHGVEAQLTSAVKEIEDLRQQVEISKDDAQRDALTGLLNRRGALRELSARREAKIGVVALCDIDHFKSVNDRFGHGVGDRVLKAFAASLSESVGSGTVVRWGGEEFLIILDGIDMISASAILDRARRDIEARSFRLRSSEEPIGTVTMSVGAAPLEAGEHGASVENADRMLYEAKRAGRNRIMMLPEPERSPSKSGLDPRRC